MPTVSSRRIVIDYALARQLYLALTDLGRELGLGGQVNLSTLLELREIARVEENEHHVEDLWPAVQEALDIGGGKPGDHACRRGRGLRTRYSAAYSPHRGMAGADQARLPALLIEYRQKLEARISRLFGDMEIDPTRLAQEVVFFTERSDVTEEMTRLHTHLTEFKRLLYIDDPVGRKLDFLLQEMNREINTTSSKVADSEVAVLVVDIKSELERIREQAQNIE